MARHQQHRQRGPLIAVLVLVVVAGGLLALTRLVGSGDGPVSLGAQDPAAPSDASATQPASSGWAPPTLAAPSRADLRGSPDDVAVATLASLVERAPVVVVADAARRGEFAAATDLAATLMAPIVTPGTALPAIPDGAAPSPAADDGHVGRLLDQWQATEVVVVGAAPDPPVGDLARLHRVEVPQDVTSPAPTPSNPVPTSPSPSPATSQSSTRHVELDLPEDVGRMVADARAAGPLDLASRAVVVLRGPTGASGEVTGVRADLAAALEQWDVATVRWRRSDPRHDDRLRRDLAGAVDRMVLAVPTRHRPAPRTGPWLRRVASAVTAPQLPGGGTALFPGRVFIASYGNPVGPALGVLGERDAAGSIQWIQDQTAAYEGLFGPATQVQPAFEIIATIASSGAEATGDYSRREDLGLVTEWVDAATDAGLYVVLDLQPGRTDFLTQARELRQLLVRPNVGLALDPEWRLEPTEFHMRQIGSVGTAEVNEVSAWLARLVRRNNLPEKLLIVHSFRLDMLTEREDLVDRWELAEMIHVDGQGWQGAKDDTYGVITDAGPQFLAWGWKNFFDEDEPAIRSPQETALVEPQPNFISYQ